MAHRLAGAVEKFNRAKEQFDELRAEIEAFVSAEPQPYFSIGEFDTETWEWIERFQVREEPPLRFGVILGDSVHNMRSCLDHVIWQVTLLDGGTPGARTQFPIASKSEAQFEKIANRRIPGLSPKHRAMVKQAQPYHRGDAAGTHPLAVLADLSNVDKHRVVHAAYSVVGWDASATLDRLVGSYRGEGPSPVQSWWVAKSGTLEHGAPWFRIQWRPGEKPPAEVKVSGEVTTHIAFGDVGLDILDYPKIAEAVRMILEAFLADFPETEFVDS